MITNYKMIIPAIVNGLDKVFKLLPTPAKHYSIIKSSDEGFVFIRYNRIRKEYDVYVYEYEVAQEFNLASGFKKWEYDDAVVFAMSINQSQMTETKDV